MSKIHQLKFVSNFHAYGNDILKPFNSVKGDLFKQIYPDVDKFIKEIVSDGNAP
jgi:hypothetical protein